MPSRRAISRPLPAFCLAFAGLFAVSAEAATEEGRAAAPVAPLTLQVIPLPEPRPERPVPADGNGQDEAEPAVPEAGPAEPAYTPPEQARTRADPSAHEPESSSVSPDESVAAAFAAEDAIACERDLASRGARFSVSESFTEDDCGILRPVLLERLSPGIRMDPPVRVLCRTAIALDTWAADALVPAARRHLDARAPNSLPGASGFVCRERTGGGRLSEHGKGSAVDITAIGWSDRPTLAIEANPFGSREDRFLAEIRRAACGPFRTVLGPGTDAAHSDHFHFDIAARRGGATYCR